MTSETQHIRTRIRFGALGFAISIYTKGSLKIGILSINQMGLGLHRSTQPTSTLEFYYQTRVNEVLIGALDQCATSTYIHFYSYLFIVLVLYVQILNTFVHTVHNSGQQ